MFLGRNLRERVATLINYVAVFLKRPGLLHKGNRQCEVCARLFAVELNLSMQGSVTVEIRAIESVRSAFFIVNVSSDL